MTSTKGIRASEAARRIHCPGSAALEDKVMRIDTTDASAGTHAHELIEWALRLDGPVPRASLINTLEEHFGSIDEDLLCTVADCYDTFHQLLGATSEESEYYVELGVSIKGMNHVSKLDAIIIDGASVNVVDFKTGTQGVKAFENPQLGYYALAAFESLPSAFNGGEIEDYKWTLTIVQPGKDEGYDSWGVTPGWLGRLRETLFAALDKMEGPCAPTNPGPWCQFCRGVVQCPSYLKHVDEALNRPVPAGGLDTVTMGWALNRLKLVEKWVKEVKKYQTAYAQKGISVPGRKIVYGKPGNRMFTRETELAEKAKMLGLNPFNNSLVSPAELERRAKAAGVDVTDLTAKSSPYITQSAPKLTYIEDTASGQDVSMNAQKQRLEKLKGKVK